MSPKLDREARFRASASVYSRPFGKEVVLLHFGRGEYYALDEIGAEIWRDLAAGASIAAIASALARAYDVSEEQALEDVEAFVADMEGRALVESVGGAGPH